MMATTLQAAIAAHVSAYAGSPGIVNKLSLDNLVAFLAAAAPAVADVRIMGPSSTHRELRKSHFR